MLLINGQRCDVPTAADGQITIAALLEHLKLASVPAAVEVNKAMIPKRQHTSWQLRENDAIEVVTLVGGG